MKGEELPDDANVVHYVSPSRVTETGEAGWDGFRRNNDGEPPSVHWLQQLGSDKAKQVSTARKVARVQLRTNGRLAELRVGDVVAQRDEVRPRPTLCYGSVSGRPVSLGHDRGPGTGSRE